MALEIEKLLDETGWALLEELQQHARLSYSELGLRVGLSAPAVAERMRRMEEAGIIEGYYAAVNPAKLGLPVTAIIRLGAMAGQSCSYVATHAGELSEVLECYRVTGSDSVILKVIAASVDHLEELIDRLTTYGLPTTSIVLSSPVKRRIVTRDIAVRGEDAAAS